MTLPVAAVPVALVSPIGAVDPALPVTPEEATDLARRIRVEARLPRVAAIGTLLGLVCGGAAIWPFIDGSGYMAGVLVGGNGFGVLQFIPGWLLAGALPLLAFYAGRLQFQTGVSSTGEIESSLRKIRRLLVTSMFASIMALVFFLAPSRYEETGFQEWLAFLYLGCFGACAAIIGDVRRGLGDFDSEHQRRRRRMARGFAVELRRDGAGGPAPSLPVEVAQAVSPLPPVPVMPVARALPVDAVAAGEDEHTIDLRKLLTVAVVVAVVLYGLRLGQNLNLTLRAAERLPTTAQDMFTGRVMQSGERSLLVFVAFLSTLAAVLLSTCYVLWIAWALLALNYGPRFRRAVVWLCIVTGVLAAIAALPPWMYGLERWSGYSGSRYFVLPDRTGWAPEIIHVLFVGVLLTRPAAGKLFARVEEIDDNDSGRQ